MKLKKAVRLLGVIIMTVLMINSCSSDQSKKSNKENTDQKQVLAFTDSLAFISAQGDTIATLSIAIADEPRERARGLMHVTHLGANEGMLFIFQKAHPLKFWMANTPLSLDIIYVNKQKEIIRIHHNTPPFSKQNFASGQPALYAIETNGGFTVTHDIREGMSVKFNLEQ